MKAWTYKRIFMACVAAAAMALVLCTAFGLRAPPDSFQAALADSPHMQVLDRHGNPLNTTYRNRWNVHDAVALHEVPDFLKQAFILSEDRRFHDHSGPDWRARGAAVLANIKAMRSVRGASTITEQVVRMLHPRPRTVWSRWLEGFEATELETHFSKDEILEFYVNQVPYAANRRGVAQAARHYFNRDLDTLNRKEMLALVVLVRAPSRLDLWKSQERTEGGIVRLAERMSAHHLLSEPEKATLLSQEFKLEVPRIAVDANEFVRHVKNHPLVHLAGWPHVRTTLDGTLQRSIQSMLDGRLHALQARQVRNGAVLAVDHTTKEILAWVVAGKGSEDTPGRFIDAVNAPRQPGSALKPMLYSLALENGWSAATLIDDAPLMEPVGHGLHAYQNYSRTFHGSVTLRQALGNSLNIPAVKTLQHVGVENYLNHLQRLGFTNLNRTADFYGNGLALGNGEVTLYELVQGYAAIADQGRFSPLTPFPNGLRDQASLSALSPEIASLIAHILSDPDARTPEFGAHSVLNFPVQTAVKTGTSSDYRDSWAVGFNYRYAVGVWMGNLSQQPTDGLTGSTGPALMLRSVFAELNRHQETQALPLHHNLVKLDLCMDTKLPKSDRHDCETHTEWFVPGTEPKAGTRTASALPIRLRRPQPGLHIAYDPRLPEDAQAFEFYIQGVSPDETVAWNINGKEVITAGGTYSWAVRKGEHEVQATVWRGDRQIAEIEATRFLVR